MTNSNKIFKNDLHLKNNLKKNNEKAVGKIDVTLWILPVGGSSRAGEYIDSV